MLLSLSLLSAQETALCSTPRVRKEYSTLSDAERSSLAKGFDALQKSGRLAYYGKKHTDLFEIIHGNDDFLPAHRGFIWDFENDLREASGDPTLTLPYIDEGTLADQYGTGARDALQQMDIGSMTGCVQGGMLENWQTSFPNSHCIARGANGNALRGKAVIDAFIATTSDFSQFSSNFENTFHAEFHIYIGGDMANQWSSNDPIFFFHHCFIDYMFLRWQIVHEAFQTPPKSISKSVMPTHPITAQQSAKMEGLCVQYIDKSSPIRSTTSNVFTPPQDQNITDNANDTSGTITPPIAPTPVTNSTDTNDTTNNTALDVDGNLDLGNPTPNLPPPTKVAPPKDRKTDETAHPVPTEAQNTPQISPSPQSTPAIPSIPQNPIPVTPQLLQPDRSNTQNSPAVGPTTITSDSFGNNKLSFVSPPPVPKSKVKPSRQFVPQGSTTEQYYSILAKQVKKFVQKPTKEAVDDCLKVVVEFYELSTVFIPVNIPVNETMIKNMGMDLDKYKESQKRVDSIGESLAKVGNLTKFDVSSNKVLTAAANATNYDTGLVQQSSSATQISVSFFILAMFCQ
eukprot:NODE_73_length_24441_cov_0.672952.p3 type:complete len:569 gc:universal NODE_73_length_24441_cov_0.672952:6850-8556(+)